MSATPIPSRADQHLARTRMRLQRLQPAAAAAAVEQGALLIDIRPAAARGREGAIAGALIIERNVLEWRLDPTSPDRISRVVDADQTLILFCDEGYASSLAAASLHDIGLHNATDIVGGFRAWDAAGLPVVR